MAKVSMSSKAHRRAGRPSLIIGWREMVSLPDLGLGPFKAKIDTGARTTALHASDIRPESRDGVAGVSFHPCHMGLPRAVQCWAPLHDERAIRNTSGVPQTRLVIRSHLTLADRRFLVEMSLADRAEMAFPMIVGRSALRGHRILINCGRSWLTAPAAAPAETTAPAPNSAPKRSPK